ncbi:MAG: UDP-3-O-(3-hydroxymyristoyl)glucosamine N-acyltransferase [Epsilonproteobacteria bacterium]|nr:UDP-3-O-(3-hydroxymyristoyl)glucosamine N-acyltransferase [Campylobacterota bacterium]
MKLSDICKHINKECKSDIEIKNLATLKEAKKDSLSFFHNSKYINDLKTTKAGAVILKEEDAPLLPKEAVAIISQNPYEDMAKVTSLFKYTPSEKTYNPTLKEGARVANSANFGKNVVIGKNSLIMAGCYIGDNVEIGDNTIIYPNVVIYHNCKIGNNCTIHSGTIIGSDGFGFAQTIKFYQIGNVVVEDNVEIGANCTIDRAALGSTTIKKGAKLDNLIQIGHNCEIGEYSIIVSQVGLSGSTILGKGVIMGGQSATAGHLKIGDRAIIAARGGVTKSLEGDKTYGGFPAVEIRLWRKMQAALMRLVKRK